MLEPAQLENFKALVEHYAEEIVQKWIAYFVFYRPVQAENLTRKIR